MEDNKLIIPEYLKGFYYTDLKTGAYKKLDIPNGVVLNRKYYVEYGLKEEAASKLGFDTFYVTFRFNKEITKICISINSILIPNEYLQERLLSCLIDTFILYLDFKNDKKKHMEIMYLFIAAVYRIYVNYIDINHNVVKFPLTNPSNMDNVISYYEFGYEKE